MTGQTNAPRPGPEPEARLGSGRLIETVVDAGSFVEWSDLGAGIADPPEGPYLTELLHARARTGLRESVLVGEASVGGHRVALIVSEFAFLGGSIGVAAAEIIVQAVHRATAASLPILAAPVSGGTRMQEGTRAFLQMVKIAGAVAEHKHTGLPYLVYLRHPTTGGVFASWGSMGQVTVAEPGALVGFLGPRVYRAIMGKDFPPDVQTAENLYRRGIIDAVLSPEHLARLAGRVLTVMATRRSVRPGEQAAGSAPSAPRPAIAPAGRSAGFDDWAAVQASRIPGRPGLRTLLRVAATDVVTLSGTGSGEADPALTLSLARFGGVGAVVMGHDRRAQRGEVALGPAALRVAGRGIRLAEELGLPLVTVIDTPGAALSKEAEEGGLAGEIGRCMIALLEVDIPTIAVILGQGAGGGALALVPCDTVLVAQNGWLSPLPPEGASAIVYRDAEHAATIARDQRIGAAHLVEDGIADAVLAEHTRADLDPLAFCRSVGTAVQNQITVLQALPNDTRVRQRRDRYRRLGWPAGDAAG